MFVWPDFLDSNRIAYRESGPNTSKDNIVVHCPFCGIADESEHMSISITGAGWRCWRRPHEHSGRSPVRLVAALLGRSLDEARRITGMQLNLPEDFAGTIKRRMQPEKSLPKKIVALTMPKEFLPFRECASARPYLNHLRRSRKLAESDLWELTTFFDMRYCDRGPWCGRIIFPIIHDGMLRTWTGRTIGSDSLRYKAESDEVVQHILWFDELRRVDADTIYVVEGPFDALKIWALGRHHGIVAMCFLTSSPSAAQIDLMHDLLPRFAKRYLLLDAGATGTAMRLSSTIGLGLRMRILPPGVKDPDYLTDWRFLAA